jgi:phospholipid transport system substrate-binding protein
MIRRQSLVALAAGALVFAGPMTAALLPATAQAQAIRSHGDADAEMFVQNEATKVLQVLNDRSMSLDQKKQTFHALIDQVADVPRITSFVLGRYRRSLTPDQFNAFAATFRDYADSVYESRLGEYSGQTLKVTGSVVRQPGDVVVSSEVIGGGRPPSTVNWRVIRGQYGYRAVDVQVAGVWLAITEQQDFVSTLDNHGGDINVLIKQLRRNTAANEAHAR